MSRTASVYLTVDSDGRATARKLRPPQQAGTYTWRLLVHLPDPPPIPEVTLEAPAGDYAALTLVEAWGRAAAEAEVAT